MKILLVKTSSIGDLIHTMPAIVDAMGHRPDIRFDWLVEERLAPICRWHPAVDKVITVAYRTWRRHPMRGIFGGALSAFRNRLRSTQYDLVLDAQGLYKSAVMTALADGNEKHGFDLASCREKLAPLAYGTRHSVSRKGHAIHRQRQLFALAIGYPLPDASPDFGIDPGHFSRPEIRGRYVLCLHGGNWRTKQWPVARWRGLARLAAAAGMRICVPWFNEPDERRARAIARGPENVLTPKADLEQMGRLIAHAEIVVSVESGLGHLASALGVPTVSLFGPSLSATHGMARHGELQCSVGLPCSPCHNKICNFTSNARAPAPCMERIDETDVWRKVERGIAGRRSINNLPATRGVASG